MSKARSKQAGSDAARGEPGERDAQTNATGAGRKADAGSAGSKSKSPSRTRMSSLKGGYLPTDAFAYVEEVNRRVDMVGVTDDLLRSEDEKLKQKVLEQLLELAYGRHSRATEIPGESIGSWVPKSDRD